MHPSLEGDCGTWSNMVVPYSALAFAFFGRACGSALVESLLSVLPCSLLDCSINAHVHIFAFFKLCGLVVDAEEVQPLQMSAMVGVASRNAVAGAASLDGGFSGAMSMASSVLERASSKATPPLSPAMWCVMLLTVLYFGAYLCILPCLALPAYCRRWAEKAFPNTQHALTFVPMLCITMISVRLRAMQLGRFDPQHWAQTTMYIAASAVAVQVLCSMLRGRRCLLT